MKKTILMSLLVVFGLFFVFNFVVAARNISFGGEIVEIEMTNVEKLKREDYKCEPDGKVVTIKMLKKGRVDVFIPNGLKPVTNTAVLKLRAILGLISDTKINIQCKKCWEEDVSTGGDQGGNTKIEKCDEQTFQIYPVKYFGTSKGAM